MWYRFTEKSYSDTEPKIDDMKVEIRNRYSVVTSSLKWCLHGSVIISCLLAKINTVVTKTHGMLTFISRIFPRFTLQWKFISWILVADVDNSTSSVVLPIYRRDPLYKCMRRGTSAIMIGLINLHYFHFHWWGCREISRKLSISSVVPAANPILSLIVRNGLMILLPTLFSTSRLCPLYLRSLSAPWQWKMHFCATQPQHGGSYSHFYPSWFQLVHECFFKTQ